jgi:hypothetical protein
MQRKHLIALTVAMLTGFAAPSFAQAPAQAPATASAPNPAPRAGMHMQRRAYAHQRYMAAQQRYHGRRYAGWHGHRHRHHRHGYRSGYRNQMRQRHNQGQRLYRDRGVGPI